MISSIGLRSLPLQSIGPRGPLVLSQLLVEKYIEGTHVTRAVAKAVTVPLSKIKYRKNGFMVRSSMRRCPAVNGQEGTDHSGEDKDFYGRDADQHVQDECHPTDQDHPQSSIPLEVAPR